MKALWTRNLPRIKVASVVVAALVAFPFVGRAFTQSIVLLAFILDGGSTEDVVLVGLQFMMVGLLVAAALCVVLGEREWLRAKAEAEQRAQMPTEVDSGRLGWAMADLARERAAIETERELQRQGNDAINRTLEREGRIYRATAEAAGWSPNGAIVAHRNATPEQTMRILSSSIDRVVVASEPLTVPADAKCPVCKALVLDGCAIVFCGSCRLVHHEECAAGHKCAAFGCGGEIPSPAVCAACGAIHPRGVEHCSPQFVATKCSYWLAQRELEAARIGDDKKREILKRIAGGETIEEIREALGAKPPEDMTR